MWYAPERVEMAPRDGLEPPTGWLIPLAAGLYYLGLRKITTNTSFFDRLF